MLIHQQRIELEDSYYKIIIGDDNSMAITDKAECSIHYIPHIFKGASNSNKIDWLRKISRDLRHRPLTSPSVSWTFFPGLHPRTVRMLHSAHYLSVKTACTI